MEVSRHQLDEKTRADFAYTFQDAAINALVVKLKRALRQTGYSEIIIAGGVGANKLLRERIDGLAKTLGVRAQAKCAQDTDDARHLIMTDKPFDLIDKFEFQWLQ